MSSGNRSSPETLHYFNLSPSLFSSCRHAHALTGSLSFSLEMPERCWLSSARELQRVPRNQSATAGPPAPATSSSCPRTSCTEEPGGRDHQQLDGGSEGRYKKQARGRDEGGMREGCGRDEGGEVDVRRAHGGSFPGADCAELTVLNLFADWQPPLP